MNPSAEVADEIVKMYLQGVEVALRVSGVGAKNVIAMLYAMQKDSNKMSGKTKLNNMLKSQSNLKVFSVRKKDLKVFTSEAKKYGVLFCLLAKKTKGNDLNELVDILVREEDAARINRIVEKFKLSTYDRVSIERELESEKAIVNPNLAMTVKSPLSEHLSSNKESLPEKGSELNRKSVKKGLDEISNELQNNTDLDKKAKNKENNKYVTHTQPKRRKKVKENRR